MDKAQAALRIGYIDHQGVSGHRKFKRPFHIAESHPRVSDNGSYVNLAAAGPMPEAIVVGSIGSYLSTTIVDTWAVPSYFVQPQGAPGWKLPRSKQVHPAGHRFWSRSQPTALQ